MAIKIEIEYPQLCETITSDDILMLKKFADIINDRIVEITCRTSRYLWKHEDHIKTELYFSLIDKCNKETLVTCSLSWLMSAGSNDLIDKIESRQFS